MGSKESHFEIINETNQTITTTFIEGVDNYDWDGNSRPDHNLVGLRIPPKGRVNRREELNANARNCPFTMTLKFSDGTVDKFRIHQKYAYGCCNGFQHFTKAHDIFHRSSNHTVYVTVKNTAQQLQNQEAEEKNKNGEAKMKNKQFSEAIKTFDDAMKKANQTSTKNAITKNKSEAYYQMAVQNFEAALKLEMDEAKDNSQQAESLFKKSQNEMNQSVKLSSNTKNQQMAKMINLKISGNQLFNTASNLEKEAFTIFEKAQKSNVYEDYVKAENKYKEAQSNYKNAAKQFEEGVKINKNQLDNSLEACQQNIKVVEQVLSSIDKIELSLAADETKTETSTEKEQNEEKNEETFRQID